MTPHSKTSPDRFAPPFLSADEIRRATFVRHLEIHAVLDSTNNRAAELARDTAIELPALVVARHQTAGRGRGTNFWWSADGALTFSILLEPAALGIGASTWPQLSLAAALAVCDALRREAPGASLGIKWPNDVIASGGKISGTLIESPGGGPPASDRVIVGVGMNINNAWVAAPHEIRASGVALCDLTSRLHDVQAVLIGVLHSLADRIDQIKSGAAELARDWRRADLLADQHVNVAIGARRIEGRCAGIADDGALVIDTQRGIQRVYSGTVRLT